MTTVIHFCLVWLHTAENTHQVWQTWFPLLRSSRLEHCHLTYMIFPTLTYSRNDLKLFCLIVRTDFLLLLYGPPGRFVERHLTNLSLYLYLYLRVTEFEEICLQVKAEDGKWRSRRDMLRKIVPDPYSGDWKSSVTVGWESGTGNRQFVRRSRMQMPSKLRLCWMMKLVSKVWRCQAMKTFVNQNGQLVIYSPWNFQPVDRQPTLFTNNNQNKKTGKKSYKSLNVNDTDCIKMKILKILFLVTISWKINSSKWCV